MTSINFNELFKVNINVNVNVNVIVNVNSIYWKPYTSMLILMLTLYTDDCKL